MGRLRERLQVLVGDGCAIGHRAPPEHPPDVGVDRERDRVVVAEVDAEVAVEQEHAEGRLLGADPRQLEEGGAHLGVGGVGDGMARAIWTGAISSGLVNVPVKLYSATQQKDLSFHQFEDGLSMLTKEEFYRGPGPGSAGGVADRVPRPVHHRDHGTDDEVAHGALRRSLVRVGGGDPHGGSGAGAGSGPSSE